MHHVYCLSGLGADKRIFNQLRLQQATLHAIVWTMPKPNETLAEYALNLASQVKHPEVVLLGVSFGGMLATELTRLGQLGKLPFTISKTIVVSSCKCRAELPLTLQTAGRLRLHRLVPYQLAMRINKLNRFIFDPKTKAEELYLKRMMLKDTQLILIKRFVNMVMTWKNAAVPAGIFHIHGNADRLFLHSRVKPDCTIAGGGHFMIWNRAEEISGVVNGLLQ